MPPIRRMLNAGAVWAYSLGDLQDVRNRYTIAGAPTIVGSPYGNVMRFDGANDYVTLGSEEEYNLRFDSGAQDFSVVAWVRLTAFGVVQVIIDKRDANDDGWLFYMNSADTPRLIVDVRPLVDGPSAITDELWHCVAAVVDRSGSALVYLDGVPGVGVNIGGEVMATTTAPRIGLRSYAPAWGAFNGDIYAIVVYDRILTPTEVLDFATNKAFDY